jgi:hypothetical protein
MVTGKYFVPDDYKQAVSFEDNIQIRYAEVLLTLRGGKIRTDGSISDATWINRSTWLRDRAGIAHLTNAWSRRTG